MEPSSAELEQFSSRSRIFWGRLTRLGSHTQLQVRGGVVAYRTVQYSLSKTYAVYNNAQHGSAPSYSIGMILVLNSVLCLNYKRTGRKRNSGWV